MSGRREEGGGTKEGCTGQRSLALTLLRMQARPDASEAKRRRAPSLLPPPSSFLALLTRLALTGLPVVATACEWFTDFKRQPHVVTWESLRADSSVVRGSPQGSVPTTGTAVAAYAVSYSPLPGAIDSMAAVANPTVVSAASLANGRMYYQINCAICHGDRGTGDGAATRFGMVPMPIVADVTKNRTDGYIFGMIRNGRGLMPSYNRIEEMDRWDVVNYVRALQGRTTGVAFDVGPLALPGVTGDRVPGRTQLGPNRWVAPFAAPATRVRTDDSVRVPAPGRAGGRP